MVIYFLFMLFYNSHQCHNLLIKRDFSPPEKNLVFTSNTYIFKGSPIWSIPHAEVYCCENPIVRCLIKVYFRIYCEVFHGQLYTGTSNLAFWAHYIQGLSSLYIYPVHSCSHLSFKIILEQSLLTFIPLGFLRFFSTSSPEK